MLLKDIPGLLPTLNNSAIVHSKLWEKSVEHIHPSQLVAFRKKTLLDNDKSNIDQEITFLIKHIQFAELDNLCFSPLSEYYRLRPTAITTTEFVSGLRKLQPEYRLALIFGLEMKLSVIRTSMLTVQQAHSLSNQTELTMSVLRSSLLSTKTIYMFWHSEESSEHVGLDDLSEVVYGAFGCSWMELSSQYENMIADHYNPLIFN